MFEQPQDKSRHGSSGIMSDFESNVVDLKAASGLAAGSDVDSILMGLKDFP